MEKQNLGPILGVDLHGAPASPKRLVEAVRDELPAGWKQHGRLFASNSSGLILVSANGSGSKIEIIPDQPALIFKTRELYTRLVGPSDVPAYEYRPELQAWNGSTEGPYYDALNGLSEVLFSDAFDRVPAQTRRNLIRDWLSEHSDEWKALDENAKSNVVDSMLLELGEHGATIYSS